MSRFVVVACAALVATGCGGAKDTALLPQGRALSTTATVSPSLHMFGDTVVARLRVIVDRRQLDPSRIDAGANFDPYERVGPVRVSRRNIGAYTLVTYEFALRCLEVECVRPPAASGPESTTGGRTTFRFAPVRILYAVRANAAPTLLRFAHWPPLESLSRINTAQLQGSQFPFRASTSPLPAVTHRVPPPLLAAVLVVAALGLLVPAGTVAGRWWRARRRPPPEPAEPSVTPLDRALLLVEEARDDSSRRTALEELASELGASELGAAATELAWSRTPPAPEAAEALVQRARSDLG